MIDLTLATDSLISKSYNMNTKSKTKETILYIFMDNLNPIRSLYNSSKMRDITYDNIQKAILCGSFYLGHDIYEWEKRACGLYDKEVLLKMKCKKCGHEANVPDYILGEFIEESHDKNVGIECPKCKGMMIRIK